MTGLAEFNYRLEELQNTFIVTSENGKVLTRQPISLSNGAQLGIATFRAAFEQTGITGSIEEVRECWSQFNIQMTAAKAESCFSLDYATSFVAKVTSEKNRVAQNEFTTADAFVARARDALAKLRIPAERVPSTLLAWRMAADQAFSAILSDKQDQSGRVPSGE